MSGQEAFLGNLRRALGRSAGPPSAVPPSPDDAADTSAILGRAERDADGLMDALAASADAAGWNVARLSSTADAASYVVDLVRSLEARSLVRSSQPVVDALDLEAALAGVGTRITVAAAREGRERADVRQACIEADLGVTGVDYAVAETGSCVLLPRRGLSRLVSLAPPVHVAVVLRGQVLPGLDELFALYGPDLLSGSAGGYASVISGPSRSADIEYTIVTGVHGPGEVHVLLVG